MHAQQGGSGGKGSGNSANQGITQGQSNAQNAHMFSGSITSPSCNNTSTQAQFNNGSNALSQQGGSGGKGSGNSANQGITQGQSNAQNSNCVSGSSY